MILNIILMRHHRVALVSSMLLLLPARAVAQTAPDADAAAAAPDASQPDAPVAPPQAPLAPPQPEAPEPPARDEGVGEARVVGSGRGAIDRIPGATTVIGEREIQRTQPLNAAEVLRRVPGVYVRDEEGAGLRPNISVRGLDPTRSRRVLMLEDGIPISLAPYSEPEMYYNPPIERMGRVEVVRGSGNILYGPQTIGGVINYVTPSAPNRESWSLRTTAGDRGLWIWQGTYGNRVDNAAFIVSAMRRQGDGVRGIGFEVNDFFGKFFLQLGPRSELMVRAGVYTEGSASTYLGLTQSMYDADPSQNPARYDYFRLRRYSLGLVHTWRITPRVELRTLVYGYTTQRDWDRQRFDRTPTAGLLYERITGDQQTPGGAIYLRDDSLSNDRAYEVYGVEPRLRARFSTGPVRHELDAGARLLGEQAHLQVLLGRGATARAGELSTDDVRGGLAASGYVQDRVILFDQLHLVPGVRVEYYAFNRRMRRDAGVDVYRGGAGSNLALIPGASVSWVKPRFTLFAGAHVGYAPPRIAAAITAAGVDQDLAAERSLNYEAGGRAQPWAWLRAEATAFLLDFQNEIIQVSGNESEFANGGASRHMGVEGAVNADLARAAGLNWGLTLGVRYTFIDARFLREAGSPEAALDGNLVPYAVPHTLVTSLAFEHPLGITAQATWSFVSRHFSDRENTPVGSANGLFGPIDAYHTVDLAARYTHRRTGLSLALAVKNVQGYFTDARGRPNVFIASRSPEGIFPGGFGQTMVTLRWDH
jgi:Fe(3+) dicitrate transport protein